MSYLSASAASLGCSCQERPGSARALGGVLDEAITFGNKILALRAEVNRFPGIKVPAYGTIDPELAQAALGIMYQRLLDSRAAYPNDRGLGVMISQLGQARLPAAAPAYVEAHMDEVLATVQDVGNVRRLPVAKHPTVTGERLTSSSGAGAKIALAAAAGLGLIFLLGRSR